jgi:hypothetical protein
MSHPYGNLHFLHATQYVPWALVRCCMPRADKTYRHVHECALSVVILGFGVRLTGKFGTTRTRYRTVCMYVCMYVCTYLDTEGRIG